MKISTVILSMMEQKKINDLMNSKIDECCFKKCEQREYAITDKEGYFVTTPSVVGVGRMIHLLTKKQALLEVKAFYKNGKIKRVKVTEEKC